MLEVFPFSHPSSFLGHLVVPPSTYPLTQQLITCPVKHISLWCLCLPPFPSYGIRDPTGIVADSFWGLRVAGSAPPACGALQYRELLLLLLKHDGVGQHMWWHLHTGEMVVLQTWKREPSPLPPRMLGQPNLTFLYVIVPRWGLLDCWWLGR